MNNRRVRFRMKLTRKRIWLVSILICVALLVAFQIGRRYFAEEERRLRTAIRQTVKKTYPEATRQVKAGYGLERFEPVGANAGNGEKRPT